jgi:hypothetical protein
VCVGRISTTFEMFKDSVIIDRPNLTDRDEGVETVECCRYEMF